MEKKYIVKLTKEEIESLVMNLQCVNFYDENEIEILEKFKILLRVHQKRTIVNTKMHIL